MAWYECLYGGGGEKVASGNITVSASAETKVTTGFKPKYIMVTGTDSDTYKMQVSYDEDVSAIYSTQSVKNNSSTSFNCTVAVPYTGTASNRIKSVDSDGFTVTKMSTTNYGVNYHYIAIG